MIDEIVVFPDNVSIVFLLFFVMSKAKMVEDFKFDIWKLSR